MPEQHIIISRTDNIGDVVLTLPIVTALKQQYPNAKISFLAREYVRDIIKQVTLVNSFISWDELDQMPEKNAVATLKSFNASSIIHVFPRNKIAKLAKKAKIPHRIGTTGRLYHWLTCNHRTNFSRSKSSLHEAQLNFKLLNHFGICPQVSLNQIVALNPLKIEHASKTVMSWLNPEKFNLILHPLSNGNGREWPIEKFVALIHLLPPEQYNILITGSAKESAIIGEKITAYCHGVNDLSGKMTLETLLMLIKHSNGLIASSTGPLHLAAALGINTLGLFPRTTTTIGITRWTPLGKKAQYLEAACHCTSKCKNHCQCMHTLSEERVREVIENWRNLKCKERALNNVDISRPRGV